MIIILIISILWGGILTFFVLSPLLNFNNKVVASIDPNLNVHQFLIKKRDDLIIKLTETQLSSMEEKQALSELYDTCERLESLGISWKQKLQSGQSNLSFILFISFLTACAFFNYNIFANDQTSSKSSVANVVIPAPVILPGSGYWVPSVNQYILIPVQGALHVYYVGMFSNTFHAKGTKVLLPFPKNVIDVSIQSKDSVTLDNTDKQNSEIVLNTPLNDDVNQIQAEFSLSGGNGIVLWQKNSIAVLPGVTIIIMPEYEGILRSFLEHFFPSINVWPARVINPPNDFKIMLSTDVLKDDTSKNDKVGELSRQFVRVGDDFAKFPEFKVVGLVPNRFSIYLLISFFSCFFIAIIIFVAFKIFSPFNLKRSFFDSKKTTH